MNITFRPQNENIKRINEIYQVLKKNYLGYLIEENTFFKKITFIRNRKIKQEEENADESISVRIRKVFEELGPAYIKLGQMLSTRPDLIGIETAEELQSLRDNTPVTPFNEIKEVIESELEKSIDEVFLKIDENPIGSASIGQVYKAKLKENGEEVAIKVQKPNSYEIVKSDIEIMKFLAKRIDRYIPQTKTYNLPAVVKEFERSIFKELNYLEEVMNMQNLSKNFKGNPDVKIPKPYTDYCTSKVIVMELIKGVAVTDLINEEYPNINKKRIAKYGVKSYFKQILIDGFFHADPHPGNLIVTEDNELCYIDMGMMGILNEGFKITLAELILLLIGRNTDDIIKQLIYMDIITPSQNTEDLQADIEDLLNRYYGADLKNMDGAMQDLLNIMFKHNVRLPREFVMIGRGIALIEDTGKKLDPDFNAATELKKLSRKIVMNKYSPGRIGRAGVNYLMQIEHLAKDLPDTINNTISKIEEGNIEVNIKLLGISEIINQLSISLILAALILGSSLALVGDVGPKLFEIPIIGLGGFMFSAVLGGILIVEYMSE